MSDRISARAVSKPRLVPEVSAFSIDSIEVPSSEQVFAPTDSGRPMNLRVLHSIEYDNPTWYAVRVVLDGRGREVGRSRRSAINMECAAELCRTDAIKLGALIYRKVSNLEAAARRLKRDLDAKAENAAQHIDTAAQLASKGAKLRAQEAALREGAKKLPRDADVEKAPVGLPSHLMMRYEKPRTREDEERNAEAFARQAVEAEEAAQVARSEAKQHVDAAQDTAAVSAAWTKAQEAWVELAPTFLTVPWG